MNEPLNTYTKVDPNSRYTAAANLLTVTNMQCDETCYIYKDFGVGVLGTNTLYYDLLPTVANDGNDFGTAVFTRTLGSLETQITQDCIYMDEYSPGGGTIVYLVKVVAGAATASTFIYGAGAWTGIKRWYTFSIAPALLSLQCHSDAARTVLEWTLALAGTGQTYRYLMPNTSYNFGPTVQINLQLANFDIGEIYASGNSNYYRMNQ